MSNYNCLYHFKNIEKEKIENVVIKKKKGSEKISLSFYEKNRCILMFFLNEEKNLISIQAGSEKINFRYTLSLDEINEEAKAFCEKKLEEFVLFFNLRLKLLTM